MSEQATTGDEGVEILTNEPYEKDGEKGQYTKKIYHLGNKMPGWAAAICPKDLKKLEEDAWNAFPNCKTVITSPYFGQKFEIKIESKHLPFDGTYHENVHGLEGDLLKKRQITYIDLANDELDQKDMTASTGDIKTFKSQKTGRGPFPKGWEKDVQPCMVAYKLVTVKATMMLIGGKVENFLIPYEQKLFLKFHRELVLWMDEWIELTLEDIRQMEEEAKERLRIKIEEAKAAKEAEKTKKKK
eukprot:TRINITY_DN50580_c0_g1_i3.p1 TRINITY_DN50580_c0_g1~~TRINITY_DN50580_c0_g1_i3.p1  ORF type:complete len:281 (+),score=40.22 TRINITY_DN50580_c0_g1_i3:116-844(+)